MNGTYFENLILQTGLTNSIQLQKLLMIQYQLELKNNFPKGYQERVLRKLKLIF